MREILFRGRCVGDDDVYGWVDGFYVRLRDPFKKRESHRIYTGFAEADCGSFYGDCYEVDSETVGQFTGLFDKNGERIYEGDIVIVTDDDGDTEFSDGGVGDVVFECGMWYVAGNPQNSLYNLSRAYFIEVIGNIYDNSELLK